MIHLNNEVFESKYSLPCWLYGLKECNYVLTLPSVEFKRIVSLNNIILFEVSHEKSYYFEVNSNYFKIVKFDDEMDLFELK